MLMPTDSLFFFNEKRQTNIFWWLKQLRYCWQRSNYKAYNGMEAFLLLFVIFRCAEVDVLSRFYGGAVGHSISVVIFSLSKCHLQLISLYS